VTHGALAISLDGLVKRYGGRTILDGIALTVHAGELVALLGPNGAGKTTTVEIIEGYRKADEGSVSVLGVDPASGGPQLRARVGLMLQGGGLDPRSTARDVLRLYAAFHVGGLDPEQPLERVGLAPVATTRVRRLSGGERQRLALALALVGDPEVIILDEPTAGMDPEGKRATRALIRELRADGRAILMTTHDLADVERLADNVAILHHGRIVAQGSPDALLAEARPRLRFRLAAPAIPSDVVLADLASVLGRGSTPAPAVARDEADGSFLIAAPPEPGLIAAVAAWAARHELLITRLDASGTTLEDRYLELTGDHDVEAAA
jgi:ABC-2 type transport system ATP-binding protein